MLVRIFICSSWFLYSLVAMSGTEGHGGDPIALSFISAAQKAVMKIIKIGNDKFPEIDLFLLARSVSGEDHSAVFAVDEKLQIKGNEVAAINYAGTKNILVNRVKWREIQNVTEEEALALHEFLGLLNLEKDTYNISARYRLLASSVDGYGDWPFSVLKDHPCTSLSCEFDPLFLMDGISYSLAGATMTADGSPGTTIFSGDGYCKLNGSDYMSDGMLIPATQSSHPVAILSRTGSLIEVLPEKEEILKKYFILKGIVCARKK